MISVVIPSRNEQFLHKTISDLLEKAREIQIIVVLDGYWPEPPIKSDERIVIIHRGVAKGMRAAINAAVDIASGEYILKTDAHCMFDEGFDVKLMSDMENDWVVVPRRYRLDAENWQLHEDGRPPIDYMFLAYQNEEGKVHLSGQEWQERNTDASLKNILIDDLMSSQGSCWFMKKDYFHYLDLLDEKTYGPFYKEFQEIGFKCWLSGGKVKINKKTWYAHLHKGRKYGRGYSLDKSASTIAVDATNRWMSEKIWKKQTLPFSSMIERFMPVPTWSEERLAMIKAREWRP